MKAAYRNCDVVAFCSRYEGFGLPILEAQAMEKPLLTTGLQPMKDVAGDGALFVDPDAASIRAGLQTIFRDEALRQRLVDAGRRNLARFDAETIAGEYARVYRRIISR
jgi:glycosyltransferase involved in cell wall biosynthesis